MSEETTAIAKTPIQMGEHGLALRTLDDAWRFANYAIASKMAPRGYDKPEQVIIAIQHGAEIGLAPIQALHSIAVINGRATVWGDTIPGLILGSGLVEELDEYHEGDGEALTAVCRIKRRGVANPFLRTFSVADAKKAGLWGKAGPWTNYPKRMLAMRARSWAARDGFADVLRGLQIREEVQDYEPRQTQPERRTIELTPEGKIAEPEPVAVPDDVVDAETEPQDGDLF